MSLILYLAVLISGFLGLFIGLSILPKYDDIIYPFGPDLSLFLAFYKILFPLGFCSMLTATLMSLLCNKSMLIATISAFLAILVDYKFDLFSNLSQHYFHFSFVLAYALGVYFSYFFVKIINARLGAESIDTKSIDS